MSMCSLLATDFLSDGCQIHQVSDDARRLLKSFLANFVKTNIIMAATDATLIRYE